MCKREAAALQTEQTGLALKQSLDIDVKKQQGSWKKWERWELSMKQFFELRLETDCACETLWLGIGEEEEEGILFETQVLMLAQRC